LVAGAGLFAELVGVLAQGLGAKIGGEAF